MKFYQAAIVALLASSVNVVNADEDCTSIVDLACSTEGFSTLCSVLTDVAPALDPDVVASLKTVFAPTVSYPSIVFFYCIPSSVDRSAIESSVVSASSSIRNRSYFVLSFLLSFRFDTIGTFSLFLFFFSRLFSSFLCFYFILHFHFFIRMMHLLLLNLI